MQMAERGTARVLLDGLYMGCGIVAGLFLVLICVLMMLISVGREVGFNVPAGDDITGWLCAASFALGLAHTFKNGDVVRVGLLVEKLDGRARLWVEAACLAFGTLCTGALAWYCIDLVADSIEFNERAQGVLPIPMWIPQSAVAVGCAVQFVAFADELVRTLGGHRPAYAKDEPKTVEEVLERAASSV